MRAEKFEDIVAWQKARELAGAVYKVTRSRELSGDYALVRQMQRAAVSVMANIAEGFGREGPSEFHRFVTIARGSCYELLSHLYLARDLEYIGSAEFERLAAQIAEVSRIIRSLRTSLDEAKRR
jgi:four helix bundle protein